MLHVFYDFRHVTRQYLFSCQIEVKGEVVEASATAPNKKSAQKKCALEMVVKLYKEWLMFYLRTLYTLVHFETTKNGRIFSLRSSTHFFRSV